MGSRRAKTFSVSFPPSPQGPALSPAHSRSSENVQGCVESLTFAFDLFQDLGLAPNQGQELGLQFLIGNSILRDHQAVWGEVNQQAQLREEQGSSQTSECTPLGQRQPGRTQSSLRRKETQTSWGKSFSLRSARRLKRAQNATGAPGWAGPSGIDQHTGQRAGRDPAPCSEPTPMMCC